MSFKLLESPFTLYLNASTPDMDVEFGFPVSQMQHLENSTLFLSISSWIRLFVQYAIWFGKTDFKNQNSPILLIRSSFQGVYSRAGAYL